MVAVPVAVCPLPLAVAVIVHAPVFRGAVNSPPPDIVPHEAAQLAPALAVNCCVAASSTVALVGEMVKAAGGVVTVSKAFCVYLGDIAAVATIMHWLPTGALAINNPAALIDPQLDVHVTDVFAVNCCAVPCAVLTVVGLTVIGEITFAVAEAVRPPPCVAVIVHTMGKSGAVKSPFDEIVPQSLVHVVEPVDVNCCVPFSVTVTCVGEILSATTFGAQHTLKAARKRHRARHIVSRINIPQLQLR